jgi:beta-lactamase regulating signal transducer with metallopeptidase domain
MLDPNLGLDAASGLVSFALKTTVESLVCLVVVRLAGSARWRFNVWLAMLMAFAAQWGWMWIQLARTAIMPGTAAMVVLEAPRGEPVRRIAVTQPIAGMVGDVIALFAVGYALVLMWKGIGGVAARVRLARAMRYGRAPSERLAEAFSNVLGGVQATGVELRDCRLRVLPGAASPATMGWRRPLVVVPPDCEMQDEQELAAIFWHELKHVQRKDSLWNGVAQLCTGLLWFHPGVHHAATELKVERELACDAAVVREHPQSRDVYASCLLRFASARVPALTGIEMASAPTLLKRRIGSILTERPRMSGWSRACRAAVNVGLIALMVTAAPRINVLFAEGTDAVILGSPVSAMELHPQNPLAAGRAPRRLARERTRSADQDRAEAVPVMSSGIAAVAHNDALAAEHRVAVDVLTESTGMDKSGSTDSSSDSLAGEAPGGTRRVNTSSLGSIAVDAAERMGPLMSDHDHDDHH